MRASAHTDIFFQLDRVITKTYNDSHYKYFVDENLEEYKNYPGNDGVQRVYLGI